MFYCKKVPQNAFLIATIYCSACTGQLHKPVQRIKITANKNIKLVSVERELPPSSIIKYNRHNTDSQTVVLKQQYIAAKKQYKAIRRDGKIVNTYLVARSNKPIVFVVGIDSTQKTVAIKPHRAYGSYLNMKYIFRKKDSLDPYIYKGWAYPRKNIITVTEGKISVARFEPVKKGTVNMTIAAGFQLLNLKRDTGRYDKVGIFGIEIGTDYFYSANRFLSFNIGAATVTPVSLGERLSIPAYEYSETGTSVHTSVRNNMIKGNFDFGYGLNLSRLYWTAASHGDSSLPARKMRTTSLGLSFSANYKVIQNLRVGILYQPGVISINSATNGYQHYIAIRATLNFGQKEHSR